MLGIQISQNYNATMTIVVFRRQRVNLYKKKASFIRYSMEIQCTWLTFIMITFTVFRLKWQCPLPDDIIHIWNAALSSIFWVFLPLLHRQYYPQILIISSSGTAAASSFTNLSHTFKQFCQLWQTRRHHCQPSFTYKHKININNQHCCCIIIIQGFVWLHARYISSRPTHHIHKIKCVWFYLNFYITAIVIYVLKVGTT